jgi:hypothetical protein
MSRHHYLVRLLLVSTVFLLTFAVAQDDETMIDLDAEEDNRQEEFGINSSYSSIEIFRSAFIKEELQLLLHPMFHKTSNGQTNLLIQIQEDCSAVDNPKQTSLMQAYPQSVYARLCNDYEFIPNDASGPLVNTMDDLFVALKSKNETSHPPTMIIIDRIEGKEILSYIDCTNKNLCLISRYGDPQL